MPLIQGSYFVLILFYPIISVFISIAFGSTNNFFKQLINEYYLLIGYTICYFAVILLFLIGANISIFESFVLFTIGYWFISFIRKSLFTGSKSGSTADITHPTE